MQHFQETGAKVFGISTDNSPSQKAFAAQLSLSFPLLSDFPAIAKSRKIMVSSFPNTRSQIELLSLSIATARSTPSKLAGMRSRC